jgi:hypothetical protein
MSYCALTDLKTYLNITAATDDSLLQKMLDAATSRINSRCGRVFYSSANRQRHFDIGEDFLRSELWFDTDISYIASVINGDGVDVTADIYSTPRNSTPYYKIGLKTSSNYSWTYETNMQNAISVSGIWAYMVRADVTALTRVSNVVTAAVIDAQSEVGATVLIVGCADTSFNGAFTVLSNTGAAVTWAQAAADDTDTTAALLSTPTDIITACRRLAAWMYRQKDTQQTGTTSPIVSIDGTVIMPSVIPADVDALILPYVSVL